jgi:osmotically-inducible protein OsmY
MDPAAPSLRGRGPKGYARTDAHLRHAIEEALAADPTLDPGGVEVGVKDGKVTLAGSVAGRRSREAVLAIAAAIAGANAVAHTLKISE